MKTCGFCASFKEHNSETGFANGYWLGDGKCSKDGSVTVQGDTCGEFQLLRRSEQ